MTQGLSRLLNDKNGFQEFTDRETGVTLNDGVSVYIGAFGSVRFVLRESGVALGGLQIVTSPTKTIVSNVFVKDGHRRQGIATRLYSEALKRFDNLTLSDDLSEDGKSWVSSL